MSALPQKSADQAESLDGLRDAIAQMFAADSASRSPTLRRG